MWFFVFIVSTLYWIDKSHNDLIILIYLWTQKAIVLTELSICLLESYKKSFIALMTKGSIQLLLKHNDIPG